MAQSAGRHAFWGLAFAGYWGYLWTLGRDLTELTAAAFVLLGFAALLRAGSALGRAWPSWAPWSARRPRCCSSAMLALSTLYLRCRADPTPVPDPATGTPATPPGDWTTSGWPGPTSPT